MTKAKIWFLAITAALGGFLFGFDTIVINGAEQDIQKLWNLSGQMHGWVVSAALWGTVLGSVAGGKVSDWFGRKNTLFGVGILFFVSAVWSAFAAGPWSMIAARFIGGLGVGVSTIAAPVYIAEISPAESRGKLTALFQFNIVLGVVVSLASNLALKDVGENAWRWMLGVEAFPALVFTALCPFLVESPRWLASRGKDAAEESSAPFFCRANLRPILLAFCVAMFNQLSGINAMMYFAKRVFEMAGFAPQVALGIGMSHECVFDELGVEGHPWDAIDPVRQAELNKRYNDKAEKIVGRRLLPEKYDWAEVRFPEIKRIGEVFGSRYEYINHSEWLLRCCHGPEDVEKMLDRVDRMDIRSFMLPENWEKETKRIYEETGRRPSPLRGVRGPVTLACSLIGEEDLIFLVEAENYHRIFAFSQQRFAKSVHRRYTCASAYEDRSVTCLGSIIAVSERSQHIKSFPFSHKAHLFSSLTYSLIYDSHCIFCPVANRDRSS